MGSDDGARATPHGTPPATSRLEDCGRFTHARRGARRGGRPLHRSTALRARRHPLRQPPHSPVSARPMRAQAGDARMGRAYRACRGIPRSRRSSHRPSSDRSSRHLRAAGPAPSSGVIPENWLKRSGLRPGGARLHSRSLQRADRAYQTKCRNDCGDRKLQGCAGCRSAPASAVDVRRVRMGKRCANGIRPTAWRSSRPLREHSGTLAQVSVPAT